MSTTAPPDDTAERNARIQQMLADAMLKLMDVQKRAQDIRYAPVVLVLTGFGTAAAVIGATIALSKLLFAS